MQLDDYYKRIGLDKGWDNKRVNRLCRMLSITSHELGKLFCVSFQQMNRYQKQNYFPPPIALHFAILEAWALERKYGEPQDPVVPVSILT